MELINYGPENSAVRWVAYFDLLGTSKLIKSGNIFRVFSAYQTACEKLHNWKQRHPKVSHCWFSDTFLLYTADGTAESFAAIEMISRWFMFALISEEIPVCGSLAVGTFYADSKNGVYLGDALVEAHDWGENQDWIGYILTPSATDKLEELGLPAQQRLNYRKYEVPLKESRSQGNKIAACVLGNWVLLSGVRNPLIAKLCKMKKPLEDDRVAAKYARTIDFLEKFKFIKQP